MYLKKTRTKISLANPFSRRSSDRRLQRRASIPSIEHFPLLRRFRQRFQAQRERHEASRCHQVASIKKCRTCGAPLEYLQDDQQFVTFTECTQIFCRPKHYADLKQQIDDMQQSMEDADISQDVIDYNKLEFYLQSDQIIMASKLKSVQDEIEEQRKKTRDQCRDLIHKVRWIK